MEYLQGFSVCVCVWVLTGSPACSEAIHRALPVHVLPRQEHRERRALRGRQRHLLHPHQRRARLRAPVSPGWDRLAVAPAVLDSHLPAPAFQRVGSEAQEPEPSQPGTAAAAQRTQGKCCCSSRSFVLMENSLLTVCLEKPVKLLFPHH